MINTYVRSAVILLLALCWPSSQAHHIFGHDAPGNGGGSVDSVSVVTGVDGNDNHGSTPPAPPLPRSGNPNQIVISKTFNAPGEGSSSPGPIDLQFLVEVDDIVFNVQNVNEYAVQEFLTNNTGRGIQRLRFDIGWGVGGAQADCAAGTGTFCKEFDSHRDGLDLDQSGADPLAPLDPGSPSPVGVRQSDGVVIFDTVLNPEDDMFELSSSTGATWGDGEVLVVEFGIDIPSFFDKDPPIGGPLNIPEDFIVNPANGRPIPAGFTLNEPAGNFGVGYIFTLRETVNPVPIPGAVWLLGTALLGLFMRSRRLS